jgi:hypothetical protein
VLACTGVARLVLRTRSTRAVGPLQRLIATWGAFIGSLVAFAIRGAVHSDGELP